MIKSLLVAQWLFGFGLYTVCYNIEYSRNAMKRPIVQFIVTHACEPCKQACEDFARTLSSRAADMQTIHMVDLHTLQTSDADNVPDVLNQTVRIVTRCDDVDVNGGDAFCDVSNHPDVGGLFYGQPFIIRLRTVLVRNHLIFL